jgi:hypothetical protein
VLEPLSNRSRTLVAGVVVAKAVQWKLEQVRVTDRAMMKISQSRVDVLLENEKVEEIESQKRRRMFMRCTRRRKRERRACMSRTRKTPQWERMKVLFRSTKG